MTTTTTTTTTHPEFYCAITLELLEDPVIAADGFSYERKAISLWFSTGHATSPRTGLPLPNTRLLPNITLRRLIAEWQRKHVVLQPDVASEEADPTSTVQRRQEVLAECAELSRQIADVQEQRRQLNELIEAEQEKLCEIQQLRAEAEFDGETREFIASLATMPPGQALATLDVQTAVQPELRGVAELLALRGLLLFQLHRLPEALQCLDDSLDVVKHGVKQRLPDTLSNKGIVLHAMGRLEEALACFQEAAAIRPCSEILNNIGALQLKLGNVQTALRTIEQAIAADKENAVAWRNKGDCLRRVNQQEEALVCYNESLKLRPNDKKTLQIHRALMKELRHKHCITQ